MEVATDMSLSSHSNSSLHADPPPSPASSLPSPLSPPAMLQHVKEFVSSRKELLAHGRHVVRHTADLLTDKVASVAAGAGAGAEHAMNTVLQNIPGHRRHMETLSDGTNMVCIPFLLSFQLSLPSYYSFKVFHNGNRTF